MNDDPDLEKRARTDLRRMVDATPPELKRRLAEMASGVARDAPRPRPYRSWQVALPVGGGVLAATLAAVMLAPVHTPAGKPSAAQGDDLALLLNVDDLDLLEQMEFYKWLDREPGLLDAEVADSADTQRS